VDDGGIVPWSASRFARFTGERDGAVAVREHTGPRAELRGLFALAEDSATRLDAYIDDGRALVAERDGAIIGHLQLVDGAQCGQAESSRRRPAMTRGRSSTASRCATVSGCGTGSRRG
jgi:hypothetical protein